MNILVTGAAGFIAMHVINKLCKDNFKVIGIDNLNNYYDVNLKKDRLKKLKKNHNFKFYKIDLCSKKRLDNLFKKNKINLVINLAAQAGVRYSLINPDSYVKSNIIGFLTLLNICKKYKCKKIFYASSSSVYGDQTQKILSEKMNVNKPKSIYAASKILNENLAAVFFDNFKMSFIGLRFFTVYGPWGRPDMSLLIFIKNIFNSRPIEVYNWGKMVRAFSYIDDITESITRLIKKNYKQKKPINEVYNIGNQKEISLEKYIKIIEKILGKKAIKRYKKIQTGDVISTKPNLKKLENKTNFRPNTSFNYGIKKTIEWYKDYYKKS